MRQAQKVESRNLRFCIIFWHCFCLQLQTCLISAVERLPLTTTGAPLVIRGRDFRVACFLIRKDRECQEVFETLVKMTQCSKLILVYSSNNISSMQYKRTFSDLKSVLTTRRLVNGIILHNVGVYASCASVKKSLIYAQARKRSSVITCKLFVTYQLSFL